MSTRPWAREGPWAWARPGWWERNDFDDLHRWARNDFNDLDDFNNWRHRGNVQVTELVEDGDATAQAA